MLTLYKNTQELPLQQTEYYIRELASGLDEVIFDISIWDERYQDINEEANIVDRAGQRYLVKQIDGGPVTAKVICQLDLDEWKASMLVGYDSGSKTVYQQIDAVKPTGWTVQDRSSISIQRTLHGDYTPLQVCQECCNVYKVYTRWDNKAKTITIYPQAMADPVGAFATRELNLKEINYKGKSQDFATRLYAYGKDGLSFADINNNKPYVDNNTYSSRVICAYWQDERYTDKSSLLADAREKLAELAVPHRSYDCSIVDLQATNPSIYGNLDFSLLTTATLIDDAKNTTVNYQVVERHVWPYHPERNDVIFDNAPQKITNSVVQIVDAIENPNSAFQQIQAERAKAATEWLLSGEGYVVAQQGNDGQWSDLLFMDTNDISTATNVLRINKNGLGFSTTGANGPYTNAWTIDGQLVADFITAGTLTANVIKAGLLTDSQNKFSLNMTTGELIMNDGTFKGDIILGGSGASAAGSLELYDSSNNLVYELSMAGIVSYGYSSSGNDTYKTTYGYNDTPDGAYNCIYYEKNNSACGTFGLFVDPNKTYPGLRTQNAGDITLWSVADDIVLTTTKATTGGDIILQSNNDLTLETGAYGDHININPKKDLNISINNGRHVYMNGYEGVTGSASSGSTLTFRNGICTDIS